jgi:glyoxylase-like metal-dependent hydrolase (beta-lactamase superfamily II)
VLGLEVKKVSSNVYLVDLEPPIKEFKRFLATYLILDEKVAVIEVGPTSSVTSILQALESLNISPNRVTYVTVSHIHLDHGGGAGTLLKNLPNAKLVVHEIGAPHMVNPQKLIESSFRVLGEFVRKYGEVEPVPAERILVGKDGLVLNLGGEVKIEVLETPGHAPHHLSFFNKRTGELWVGEAAGVYLKEFDVVRPSTPPPGFDYVKSLESLDKLLALNPKILYYTHFGVSNKIENLKIYKEKLRLWFKIVSEEYEKGKSSQEIFQKILDEDQKIKRLLVNERERIFMLNSVNGMIHYLKKSKKYENR